ncbi:MAG: fumarate reductase subunit C [Gemmatimonadetes bacterium]|nr:fumarate reductase subunit C [Gemmatimonadota bacterium]
MSDHPGYTAYHPRWRRTRVSTWWWLERRAYLRFILRELSSVFVAWFVLFFLLLIRAISQGSAAYERFLDGARHPLMIGLNIVSLLFIVFHAITWFNLTPAAVAVRLRGKRVAPVWVAAPNYVLWVIVSAVVLWLFAGNP